MAHDVFISHSAEDKAVADAVCATLESKRIRCWIAPRDVVPGTIYSEALAEALQASRVLVLVLSGHSNRSQHVMRELEAAVDNGIPILPVRIEDVQPSKSLGYYLKTIHWLDALTPPLEEHLRTLADVVERLLARDSTAPPPVDTTVRTPVLDDRVAVPAHVPEQRSRRSRWLLASVPVVLVALLVAIVVTWMRDSQPSDGVERDLEMLQGRWERISFERNGKRESVAAGTFAIEFRGDEVWTYDGSFEPTRGRIFIRASEPRTVEEAFEYESDGQKRRGRIAWIYRFVSRDLLEVATPADDSFDSPSPIVPKGFDSTSGEVEVSTYERKR
jgi:uncharacterized protein (TIGR03067 family)